MCKRIIAMAMVILAICLMTISAYATEETVTEVAEAVTEVAEEATETVDETVGEVVTEQLTEAGKSLFNLTSEDIAFIKSTVENASSKAEAILQIATRFDIKVEDAEKFIDTIVEFGDKVYGEDEQWVKFKEDIFANKRFYSSIVIIGVCGLILIFLLIFILRNGGLLKVIKADRDFDMADNDEYREALEKHINTMFAEQLKTLKVAMNDQLKGFKEVLAEGKTIEAKEDALSKEITKLIAEFDESHIAEIRESLANSEESSAAALKISHETALHILQLLYIIMEKSKMPSASEETKRLWYENAVNSINKMMPAKEGDKNAREA